MTPPADSGGRHRVTSINRLTAPRVAGLVAEADSVGIQVEVLANGCTVVDAGIHSRGSLEAGRRIADICLGGLGSVRLTMTGGCPRWPLAVDVHTRDPVLACLGSQYAGWSLVHGEGKQAFRALGSGPGRALARKEPLFGEIGYTDSATSTTLVMEVDSAPPVALADEIAAACQVTSDQLTLILTPTTSLCGTVQIIARVLEVAMHKIHELGFSLDRVIDGAGSAPLSPPAADFVQAMGRTNDAILFGGCVHVYVNGGADDAEQLAAQLPSCASRDYGKPFADVFESYERDFFQIDPMLFSPASVIVTDLDSGCSFHGGTIDHELVDRSFGATS